MSLHQLLITLCILVIASYAYNYIGKRLKIPSVLLLLATGSLLQLSGQKLGDAHNVLEVLGMLGLILIVLEGSLDLKITREKLPLIRRAVISAVALLAATAFLIAFLLQAWLDAPFYDSLLNAIPLAVISSAIAIPSVASLSPEKKEFITYEATFSDIAGIMFFNFMVANHTVKASGFLDFGINLIIIIAISIVSSIFLMWFINRIESKVKFFLIISVILLIYIIAKDQNLPSLLLVLVFGLVINNSEIFMKSKALMKWLKLNPDKLQEELKFLTLITEESAFLIRTFFFVVFGFTIHLADIISLDVLLIGLVIIIVLLIARYITLKFISRLHIFPEILIAPRGLITILLYYSMPEEYLLKGFSDGIILFVIIATSILMTFGLVMSGGKKSVTIVDDLEDFIT